MCYIPLYCILWIHLHVMRSSSCVPSLCLHPVCCPDQSGSYYQKTLLRVGIFPAGSFSRVFLMSLKTCVTPVSSQSGVLSGMGAFIGLCSKALSSDSKAPWLRQLARRDWVQLFPNLQAVNYGGSIHTLKISKHYKSGWFRSVAFCLFALVFGFVFGQLIHQHIPGSCTMRTLLPLLFDSLHSC